MKARSSAPLRFIALALIAMLVAGCDGIPFFVSPSPLHHLLGEHLVNVTVAFTLHVTHKGAALTEQDFLAFQASSFVELHCKMYNDSAC